MKKISLVLLVVLFMLVLSGCDSDTMETLDVGGHETYYTQEEVDEIILELRQDLEYVFNEQLPETYYTKDELDDGFDKVLLELIRIEGLSTQSVCVFPTAIYLVVDYEETDEYVYMTDRNGIEYYQLASLEHECINFEMYVIRALEEQ